MALPLNRPSLRRKDFDLVIDAMVHDRLLAGETTSQFTKDLLKVWKLSSGELLSSVNEAVRRAFLSLSLKPQSRIVLSALAPRYWFEGATRLGLEVVVCDVQRDFPVMGSAAREMIDREGAAAIVLDCALGYVPEVGLFQETGVPMILDVSQGVGGRWGGRPLTQLGEVVFTTFGVETLLAGAGGSFWGSRGEKPHEEARPQPWEELPDLTAALVSSQWKDLDELVRRKQENFELLAAKVPEPYRVPAPLPSTEPVHPWLPVVFESGAREIMAYARKRSVEVEWAFPGRADVQGESMEIDPHARYFQGHTLLFPLYSTMSRSELDHLSKVLASLP